jgi:hypothetical protein
LTEAAVKVRAAMAPAVDLPQAEAPAKTAAPEGSAQMRRQPDLILEM